ncbi:MAG TPA: response regulator [Gaiellaceae bacterium]|nr:response regulator [Gaiellaceae bacterium]
MSPDDGGTTTLTFLFSDVEGSTALLRKLRDRYTAVIGDHERLLRGSWEQHAGRELDADGDSFFVAFRRPRQAVDAAVAAQRALAAHDWPDGVDLRVRIGIHTGEATLAGDQYVGLAVHRAARICDAGHGGQILVSETTRSLLEDEEHDLDGIRLRDLGPQQLKDFDRPVRIYQLSVEGLAGEFPALRTAGHGAAELADRQELATLADDDRRARVLIVDDQALVRTGFRMILEAETDLEVVGEAADGLEAVEQARRLEPDVVLMDVRMPEVDGIEATRRLLETHGSQAKVVMLTTFDMDEYVYEALRAGASGFLLKDVPPEQLVAGIRAVASGDALLAPSVTRRVIEEFVRRPPDSVRTPPAQLGELTARELEVLKLIARGLSNAEIAGELVVSETTVKTHVAHVLMKLQLRDRVQAVVLAYESGLVQPGEA